MFITILYYNKCYSYIIAYNDSHLLVVQARNLIVFVQLELRRVTAKAVVEVVKAH